MAEEEIGGKEKEIIIMRPIFKQKKKKVLSQMWIFIDAFTRVEAHIEEVIERCHLRILMML